MVIWQKGSKRKSTGGRIWQARRKRRRELGAQPVETKLGETQLQPERVFGGKAKVKALAVNVANVVTKSGESKKVNILRVIETPANLHYARSNVITKGTIIETELGKAKVTSRPGQHGIVNAILVSET
ncbi:MAG: 30S ribosomal protein S8e [Euryarchaeota archaeon]|nr:30S ribosomal protein S8e [Euryarchaeota archaeon]